MAVVEPILQWAPLLEAAELLDPLLSSFLEPCRWQPGSAMLSEKPRSAVLPISSAGRIWPACGPGRDRAATHQEDRVSVSILIVDDEPDVAELFRQRFRREARQGTYVLHFAASGEEALDMLGHEIEPQLIVILSDINMPGIDGLALLREVKRQRPELPVMMVTAYGDDERRQRAIEYGAAEFITKPVDFDLLKRQLAQLASGAD
jgi:CheY-like chemotaxis protein